jgi:hypothetical protein
VELDEGTRLVEAVDATKLVVCVASHTVEGPPEPQAKSVEVSRLRGAVVFEVDVVAFPIGVPCSAIFCSSAMHRTMTTKKTNSEGVLVEKGL